MKLLLKNVKSFGHFINSEKEFEVFDVLIEDSKVTKLAIDIKSHDAKVYDCKKHFLYSGLIDPQVHFREPGFEYKEDIESGSRAAVKGGFTSVISMPNTLPTADNYETVKYMWDKQLEVGICRVFPTGAVTKSLRGEELTDFDDLKKAHAVALTDDGKGIQSDEIFYKAMENAAKVDLPLLDHSEDESLSKGGAIHLGAISEKFKIKGIDSNSESVHVKRGCEASLKTGAHFHVLHVSTKSSIDFIKEAKKKNARVTVEVSPHHLLLCDEDIPLKGDKELDANFKMNPPLRSKEDRQACVEGLLDGTIDAIATDHAPHSPQEKAQSIDKAPFGIIGLETAFPLIYTEFVRTNKMSLQNLFNLMSDSPRKIFKLESGHLQEGELADLVLFDLDEEFSVDHDFFASKSKNSPFINRSLFGATKLTITNGKIVYNSLDV